MRMYDIIEKKRDGFSLSEAEISFFINGYVDSTIPDYQVSALLMAIYFQEMTDEESALLTMAIVNSGEIVDLSPIKGVKVDKHSTGGVGDTVSLILSPLVASLGIPVPKMSGRGLGHTGGTIDKLESISGFHVKIDNEEFINLINKNKIAIIGQSEQLAPADKLLYSLRDVTATVNSIPLIASSIMSKKIAAGADAIVLDVKTGAGAFMEEYEQAKQLAHTMVSIGENVGRKTTAVISNMEQPLGQAVGNAIEIKEAITTLKGDGPEDLLELCLTLGSEMVVLAQKANSRKEARQQLLKTIESGAALETFKTFIRAQSGDERVVDQPELLPQASYEIPVYALQSGLVGHLDALKIGRAAMLLGAGRETKESQIDLAVGVIIHKKVSDHVVKGEPLFTIYANQESVSHVQQLLYESVRICTEQMTPPTLIFDVITK